MLRAVASAASPTVTHRHTRNDVACAAPPDPVSAFTAEEAQAFDALVAAGNQRNTYTARWEAVTKDTGKVFAMFLKDDEMVYGVELEEDGTVRMRTPTGTVLAAGPTLIGVVGMRAALLAEAYGTSWDYGKRKALSLG